ncbi:scavenger receptor class B member 1-like isoform X1 [Diprion similis]|uniref:scavenger receptor class B member 1-like isoform X1 n=1 Tax=Diprion similis TaxID=362088 RepID=UPI001EF99E04|nr:scavenger receptor class B member 1-like isoform X1 [Diprion similis]
MKEVAGFWDRLTGRRYSAVSTNPCPVTDTLDSTEPEYPPSPGNHRSLRRKSSVVVNQFFNAALPVHSDGRPRWPRSIFVLMTLGLLGIASGCFVLVFQPYDILFKLKVTFSEGGEIFELWRSPPVDLYLKIYLFNVTNSEQFLNGEEDKLRINQVGPYVYKELMEHGNVTFNENGTVTAIPRHPLKYIPEMSNGTEEDLLILPNIALLSITNVMRDANYFSRMGLNLLISQSGSKPLVEMTAKEFMFGYESALVTLGNSVMPSWIKFDRLGLIDRMYDFEGDIETVYTGETDVSKAGLIDTYNYGTDLPQWTGRCANVQGASDGTKFRGYLEPNQTLHFFRKSLCRSVEMYYTSTKTIKGLEAFEYKFVKDELDNGAVNPRNKCFCRERRCLPPGLIDVTDCYYGFPIALSYPHFYQSDPSLLNSVEGLTPNQKDHESYFYIQPMSGLPVDLAFRYQINMALQDISSYSGVEKFKDLVLPLLWFEIGMHELPKPINDRFLLYLNVLPLVQEVAIYVLFTIGVLFLVWSVVKILFHKPNGYGGPAQWLDTEMQRKRLSFLNERRSSLKPKELETYYSSLLSPTDNTPTAPQEDLPCLTEEHI